MGRSCVRAPASSCADGDRAPLSPSDSSASSRDAGQPCSHRQPTGGATSAPPRRGTPCAACQSDRSEEHTSELQSLTNLVCRLLLEKKKELAITAQPTTKPPTEMRRRT